MSGQPCRELNPLISLLWMFTLIPHLVTSWFRKNRASNKWAMSSQNLFSVQILNNFPLLNSIQLLRAGTNLYHSVGIIQLGIIFTIKIAQRGRALTPMGSCGLSSRSANVGLSNLSPNHVYYDFSFLFCQFRKNCVYYNTVSSLPCK